MTYADEVEKAAGADALAGRDDDPGMSIEALLEHYLTMRKMSMPSITSGVKAVEEAQELVAAIADGTLADIRHEIADLALVAAVCAKHYGTTVEDCVLDKASFDANRGEPSGTDTSGAVDCLGRADDPWLCATHDGGMFARKSGRRCSMAEDHAPESKTLEQSDPGSGPCPMCRAIERWPNASCPDPWHHNYGRPFVRGERVLGR